jgi:tetratricopeptide (TPR) repeat protein
MATPQSTLERKLKMATGQVVRQYSDAIRGLFVIGSATTNPTPTSDLDVLLVFDDDFFNIHFAQLRRELDRTAFDINAILPQHELAFWISKADHHNTLLPDVSYLRANSPTALTRLDGWCGLAKFSLLGYVVSSGARVYGDFDFPLNPRGAPRTEAAELFLIATRALAKGVSGHAAAEPEARALAANDLAKAGLRAIAAVLLRRDQKSRLGYGAILESSKELLPETIVDLVSMLYKVKTGSSDEEISLAKLIGLFDYCERELADVPPLKLRGLAHGRAGESFAFDAGTLTGTATRNVEDYSRFVFADENYYLNLYFTRTAYRIVELFADMGLEDIAVLDFFLPELAVMATFAVNNPGGVRLVLGQAEREDFELKFGIPFIDRLVPLFAALAKAYVADNPEKFDRPWLRLTRKRALVHCALEQLCAISDVEVVPAIRQPLEERVSNEDHFDIAEWQSEVMKGMLSPLSIHSFAKLGLKLYQIGEIERAQRVLEPMASLADRLDACADIVGQEQLAQLRESLSSAIQYFALTFHRQGDAMRARKEYLRALELAPSNQSALADLCTLLLAHDQGQESVAMLASLVEKAGNTESARAEVARQYLDRAIESKRRGAFDEAKAWYQGTIDIYPTWPIAHFNFGLLLEARGEPDAAVAEFQKAIELDHGYVKPRNRLADLWREQGQLGKALNALREIVDLKIATADSFNCLGCCYLMMDKIADAEAAFKIALELDSGHAIALSNLAGLLAHRGRQASDLDLLKHAAAYLEQSLAANPGDMITMQQYQEVLSDIKRMAAQSRN